MQVKHNLAIGERRTEEASEERAWPHGAAAGQAYNRNSSNDAYWPQGQTRTLTRYLWHVLPTKKEGV